MSQKNTTPQLFKSGLGWIYPIRTFAFFSTWQSSKCMSKVDGKLSVITFDDIQQQLATHLSSLPSWSGQLPHLSFFFLTHTNKKKIWLQAHFIPGPTAPRQRWGLHLLGWCLGGLYFRRQSQRSRSAWPSDRRSSEMDGNSVLVSDQKFKNNHFYHANYYN